MGKLLTWANYFMIPRHLLAQIYGTAKRLQDGDFRISVARMNGNEGIMDRLDKFNIAIIVLISLVTIGMLVNREITEKRQGNHEAAAAEKAIYYAEQMALNAKIYQEVISLKEQELNDEAMTKLQEVMKAYPGRSQSYVYMAQLSLKSGKLADTIHNYRLAVESDPDYLDKKTPLFIGREIKALVSESLEKFGREVKLKPNDKAVRNALEDLYYLQRRLAGGCE
jgi:tetratricopeptide (TPR) repeat protein